MSTRIHRAIGYGAVHPEGTAFRDRFHEGCQDGEVAFLMEAEHAAMKATPGMGGRLAAMSFELPSGFRDISRYPGRFEHLVSYASHPERADGVWIIAPPSARGQWCRVDDTIDYYDAMARENPTDPALEWLGGPIYPYVDHMDAETGNRLKAVMDEETGLFQAARDIPGAVPMPPDAVAAIARHLGFDWKALRPVIATWWC